MIKSVTVTNSLGDSIKLVLTDPWSSGFAIISIDGLGPVSADINFTELATIDGAIDNSVRIGTRNIVLELQFLEFPTIEDTRLRSYRYFPVKGDVELLIETDRRLCSITGKVESNEPDIFSQKEGCQVSILCTDPYFYLAGPNAVTRKIFYGTEPLFEFPFSNESLTEPLIQFGNIVTQTEGVLTYEGDAEVGITIIIHSTGAASGLAIYNLNDRQIMRINDERLETLTGQKIQAGDTITIVSTRKSKSVTLLRGGVVTNILNAMEFPIRWFMIKKGDNRFAYTAEEGLANLNFQINHKTLYMGV